METMNKTKLFRAVSMWMILLLVLVVISNVTPINAWINSLLYLFRPVLIGLVIAYLANSFFRLYETRCFAKIRPFSLKRGIALFFTYLSILLIFAILIVLIVPQLLNSILDFINNADKHVDRTVGEINKLIATLNTRFPSDDPNDPTIEPIDAEWIKTSVADFLKSVKLDTQTLLNLLSPGAVTSIFGVAESIVRIIADMILGLFISFYLLNTKEKRYAQIMRMRRALLSDSTNAMITRICTTADRSFGGFIKGKMLDSTMVGILVYIAISIMGVPYAILIAVIIGITDFVPVIGPFIGVIPSAVIILLTDPGKVIPFLLCILIVQQIDGNIIAPKILGENTGVSSLCVMIAITTMGALWGLVGMVIGVPLFATILELTSNWLNKRLEKRGLTPPPNDEDDAPEVAGSEAEENMIQRIQKKFAIRDRAHVIGGKGSLTALEHLQIDSFRLLHKYQVDTQKPDVLPSDFVEEEIALTEAAIEQVEEEIAAEEAEEAEKAEAAIQNETPDAISSDSIKENEENTVQNPRRDANETAENNSSNSNFIDTVE
ncbi:MAG: AI-2E family transporter [Ruminococcaceae bacterium]|nr:AI-2E family transporter [Oscillospiraceae bacterium]